MTEAERADLVKAVERAMMDGAAGGVQASLAEGIVAGLAHMAEKPKGLIWRCLACDWEGPGGQMVWQGMTGRPAERSCPKCDSTSVAVTAEPEAERRDGPKPVKYRTPSPEAVIGFQLLEAGMLSNGTVAKRICGALRAAGHLDDPAA